MSAALRIAGKTTYTPDWMSEADAVAWLNVDRSTLYRMREKGKINFSKFAGTVMYDRNELRSLINNNSTYPITKPEMKLV